MQPEPNNNEMPISIYVIVACKIYADQKKSPHHSSIDVVGVYSDYELAEFYVELLTKKAGTPNVIYTVLEYYLDKEPPLLEYLEIEEQKMMESLEKELVKMMKQGLIDQLIGEDGRFYYQLTKKGKELGAKDVKKMVREKFRKFGF